MKRALIATALLILAAAELFLALSGPMPFRRKPSLLVTNPYTYDLDPEAVDTVFAHLQRIAARSRRFRVIPHNLIENYFLERQDNPDVTLDGRMSYQEYREMAKDLEIEQLMVPMVFPGSDATRVSLIIRDVRTGSQLYRFRYESQSVDAFLEGSGIRTEPVHEEATAERAAPGLIEPAKDLRVETGGVEAATYLFIAWIAGQVLLAMVILLGSPLPERVVRRTAVLVEVLLVAGLAMFLFALFYARNADMDYVQRFIAERGQISLAEDTSTEQLRAAIRYLPLLLINLGLYVRGRLTVVARAPRDRMEPDAWGALLWRYTERWGFLLAVASAILYALSFPSFARLEGAPIPAWICLVPLLLAIRAAPLSKAAFYVVVFGAVGSLLLNYWHSTYSYISLAFSVGISVLFYVLWAFPYVAAVKHAGRWGFITAAAFWVVFEHLRSIGFIGYPWGLMGVSQYRVTPIIQIADLTGVWGVSFVVVLVNAAIAWTPGAQPRHPAGGGYRRRWAALRLPGVVTTVVMVLVLGYGVLRLLPPETRTAAPMRIVLVQQNTDPRKHDYDLSFSSLMELTDTAIRHSAEQGPGGVDLVVWPEGGFKSDIRYWLDRPESRHASADRVTTLIEYQAALGTWLVTGTQDHMYQQDPGGERERRNFNSSAFFSPDGAIEEIYHKMHLVPFTEHFPFQEQYPQLTELLDQFDTSNWKQGERQVIFQHPKARFFTPICFEDIFPDDVRRFVRRDADLIVNISNDYWALTPVEGMQHAAHALFRAVENRRPMVRATCSGFTTYITARGRIHTPSAPFYEPAWLTVDVPVVRRGETFYTRTGDWFPWASGALVLLGLGLGLLKRRS